MGLDLAVTSLAGLAVEPAAWPPPLRLPVGGRQALSAVHAGTMRGAASPTLTAPPGSGGQVVRVTVRFQPWTGEVDLPPAAVILARPVWERALIGQSLPRPSS